MKLVRAGENSLRSKLKPMPQSVHEDDVLMNLFVPSVESPLPLAVLDTEGRLTGVIPRVTLLAALGPGPTATEEITVLPQPLPSAEIDAVLDGTPADAPVVATENEGVR